MFFCIYGFFFVFLSAGLFAEQASASILARDCNTYHASKPIYTIRGTEYRASHGVNCTQNLISGNVQSNGLGYPPSICNTTSHCTVQTYAGTVPALSTLNISRLSKDDEHHLFKLIGRATDLDFHRTSNGSFAAGMASSCLHLGQSGYIGVYPSIQCTEGVLSNCGNGGPVPDGTAVRACAPVRFGSEASLSFEFVNTTAAATANMIDDPIAPMKLAEATKLLTRRCLYLIVAAMVWVLVT